MNDLWISVQSAVHDRSASNALPPSPGFQEPAGSDGKLWSAGGGGVKSNDDDIILISDSQMLAGTVCND